MDAIEQQFREIEKILDGMLRESEGQLRSSGIQIIDQSARTYHYKNDHLFWSYSFQKEWLVEVERARVTVGMSYGEPVRPNDAPEIKVSWRAELYRQAQVSRIDKKGEKTHSLSRVQHEGVSFFVNAAIEEGAACLPNAL